MKPKNSAIPLVSTICLTPWPRLLVAACSLGALSLSQIASAESYTYDADTATPGAQDGSGLGWNTTDTNWLLNPADPNVAWPNLSTDTAVFGTGAALTAAKTIAVGNVNVGTLQFNTLAAGTTSPTNTYLYTLSAGTITLGTGITATNTANTLISAVITGTNGLAFNGVANAANGLTLNANNTYTGITTLSTGGRLSVGNFTTPLGSSASASASDLGTDYTLVNAGTNVAIGRSGTLAEAFLINGVGQVNGATNPQGAIRFGSNTTLSSLVRLGSSAQITSNGSGTVTISGNLDLAGFTLSVGNGTQSFNLNVPLNVSGVLQGGSTSILDVGAAGGTNLVNLTGTSNTFSGTVRVHLGTGASYVGLGNDTVLGTGTLVFSNGGVRSTDSTPRTIVNTIGTFTGNAVFGPAPATPAPTQIGTLNFTSTATTSLGTSTRTLTTNVDTTLAATLSNTGGLTKAGAATLFLTNTTSTRTGVTTINAGILNVASLANGGTGNFSSIGASSSAATSLVFAGGTLQYTGSTAQSTDRLFTIGGSTLVAFGSSTLNASGSDPAATLDFTNTGAIVSGNLNRSASLPVTNTTLTGLVSTADLKVGATVTGTGIAAGTTISSITNATTIVLSQATTNGTVATNTLSFGGVDRSLVLTGTNTGTNRIAGILSDNSASALLSISKTGNGTWALSGANTYTGTTTVTAGTLLATNTTGSATGTGAVTVATTGTLGGNGSIAGATTIGAGGIIAPGLSAGTLTLGGNTAIAGTYACQLDGAANGDKIAVTGNLDLTGSTLAVSTLGGGASGDYVIATYTGTLTGTFAASPALPAGYSVSYATAGQVKLEFSAATDFDTWLDSFAPPITGADRLPTGDPDGDGLKNQQEYAFGLVPNSGSSVNPIAVPLNKTTGKFSYTRRTLGQPSPALAYTVETSTNLTGWTVDAGATETVTATVGEVQTVEVTLSAALLTETKLFVRVLAQ